MGQHKHFDDFNKIVLSLIKFHCGISIKGINLTQTDITGAY